MIGHPLNLMGQRFGRLVVIGRGELRDSVRQWRCRCDCGREREVFAHHLRSGRSKSCGCRTFLRAEWLDWYEPVPESGCWLYTGRVNGGYGRAPTGRKGRSEGAHRAFYRHLKGPIPPGMFVCHKCDTPLCVNPDHMFLGTHDDNMADMARKGRCGMTRERRLARARAAQGDQA